MEDDLKLWEMEADLNFWAKRKTTSILIQIEDDLNIRVNGRLLCFNSMKNDLNFGSEIENNLDFNISGRQHQFFCKWRTTSKFFNWKTNSVTYWLA